MYCSKKFNYGVREILISKGKLGFGFTLSGQYPCRLNTVSHGGSAEKAGLKPNDQLLTINGIDVSRMAHDEVVKLIGTTKSRSPICSLLLGIAYSKQFDEEDVDDEYMDSDDDIDYENYRKNQDEDRYFNYVARSRKPLANKSDNSQKYQQPFFFQDKMNNLNASMEAIASPTAGNQVQNRNSIKSKKYAVAHKIYNRNQFSPYQTASKHTVITRDGHIIMEKPRIIKNGTKHGSYAKSEKIVGQWVDAFPTTNIETMKTSYLQNNHTEIMQSQNNRGLLYGNGEGLYSQNDVKRIEAAHVAAAIYNKQIEEISRCVVFYVGSVDGPYNGNLKDNLKSVANSAFKRLKTRKSHKAAVMELIFNMECETLLRLMDNCSCSKHIIASYAYVSLIGCELGSNDDTVFILVCDGAIVTSVQTYACHVFRIDQSLVDHRLHYQVADQLSLHCSPDLDLSIANSHDACIEFPVSARDFVDQINSALDKWMLKNKSQQNKIVCSESRNTLNNGDNLALNIRNNMNDKDFKQSRNSSSSELNIKNLPNNVDISELNSKNNVYSDKLNRKNKKAESNTKLNSTPVQTNLDIDNKKDKNMLLCNTDIEKIPISILGKTNVNIQNDNILSCKNIENKENDNEQTKKHSVKIPKYDLAFINFKNYNIESKKSQDFINSNIKVENDQLDINCNNEMMSNNFKINCNTEIIANNWHLSGPESSNNLIVEKVTQSLSSNYTTMRNNDILSSRPCTNETDSKQNSDRQKNEILSVLPNKNNINYITPSIEDADIITNEKDNYIISSDECHLISNVVKNIDKMQSDNFESLYNNKKYEFKACYDCLPNLNDASSIDPTISGSNKDNNIIAENNFSSLTNFEQEIDNAADIVTSTPCRNKPIRWIKLQQNEEPNELNFTIPNDKLLHNENKNNHVQEDKTIEFKKPLEPCVMPLNSAKLLTSEIRAALAIRRTEFFQSPLPVFDLQMQNKNLDIKKDNHLNQVANILPLQTSLNKEMNIVETPFKNVEMAENGKLFKTPNFILTQDSELQTLDVKIQKSERRKRNCLIEPTPFTEISNLYMDENCNNSFNKVGVGTQILASPVHRHSFASPNMKFKQAMAMCEEVSFFNSVEELNNDVKLANFKVRHLNNSPILLSPGNSMITSQKPKPSPHYCPSGVSNSKNQSFNKKTCSNKTEPQGSSFFKIPQEVEYMVPQKTINGSEKHLDNKKPPLPKQNLELAKLLVSASCEKLDKLKGETENFLDKRCSSALEGLLQYQRYDNEIQENGEKGTKILKKSDYWLASFDLLIRDPAGLATFREFLKKEFCEENIDFWCKCEEYKKLPDNLRCKMADAIYESHLAPNASDPINVDCNIVKEVQENIKTASPQLFCNAQSHIYQLMKQDKYARFKTSDLFIEAAKLEADGLPFKYLATFQEYDKKKKTYSMRSRADKGNSSSNGEKRKSLLLWNRKKYKSSTDSISNINLNRKQSASTSNIVDALKIENQGCIVHLPSGKSVHLDTNSNSTISTAFMTLGEDIHPGLPFFQPYDSNNKKYVDASCVLSNLSSVELYLHQLCIFRVDLLMISPTLSNRSTSYIGRAKPIETLGETLKPLLLKHRLDLKTVECKLFSEDVLLNNQTFMQNLNCKHICVCLKDKHFLKKSKITLQQSSSSSSLPIFTSNTSSIVSSKVDISLEALRLLFDDVSNSNTLDFALTPFNENGYCAVEKIPLEKKKKFEAKRLNSFWQRFSTERLQRFNIDSNSKFDGNKLKNKKENKILENEDDENLFELLSRVQSRQLDDQRGSRCSIVNLQLQDFMLRSPYQQTIRSSSDLNNKPSSNCSNRTNNHDNENDLNNQYSIYNTQSHLIDIPVQSNNLLGSSVQLFEATTQPNTNINNFETYKYRKDAFSKDSNGHKSTGLRNHQNNKYYNSESNPVISFDAEYVNDLELIKKLSSSPTHRKNVNLRRSNSLGLQTEHSNFITQCQKEDFYFGIDFEGSNDFEVGILPTRDEAEKLFETKDTVLGQGESIMF